MRARLFPFLLLVSSSAWAQPVAVETAQVEIVPARSNDADDIVALERGVELVLCQAGVRPRIGGREAPAELKVVASLARAEFEANAAAGELAGRCEFTEGTVTLPGGAQVALPDMAVVTRTSLRPGRSPADTFFISCGASFTRGALDAVRERIKVGGPGCDAPGRSRSTAPRRTPGR